MLQKKIDELIVKTMISIQPSLVLLSSRFFEMTSSVVMELHWLLSAAAQSLTLFQYLLPLAWLFWQSLPGIRTEFSVVRRSYQSFKHAV